MLYVKIMSDLNMADEDSRKPFRIIVAEDVEFNRAFERGQLVIRRQDASDYEYINISSNVYVMNANGKTIASYSPNPISEAEADSINKLVEVVD